MKPYTVGSLLCAAIALSSPGCGGSGGGGDDGGSDHGDGGGGDGDSGSGDPDGGGGSDGGSGPDGGGNGGDWWHPGTLALGTIYEGDPGADSFFDRVGPGFPAGTSLDFCYLYLNGGGQMSEWQGRVERLVAGAARNDMTPILVVYGMNGGSDSAGAIFDDMRSDAFVASYFAALRDAVVTARDGAGDAPVGYLLEPDMLGYLQQQVADDFGGDPTAIPASVHAAYSAGVLVHGTDPEFPDSLSGLVQAINHTIRKYDGGAFLGWQLNLWGAPGGVAKGIIHSTEELGQTAGLDRIRQNAIALASFADRAGIAASNANFVSIDKYGLDGGGAASADPNNPADSYWFWNADLWNNYLVFVATLHDTLALPLVLWQIPVGHINVTGQSSPTAYNPSGTFPALDNTAQHYEDSASSFFFGDTITTSGSRLTYFRGNVSADPKITSSGSTVTWGPHFDEAADAGVVAILFGAGVGVATRGVPQPSGPSLDQPTDGYYWISRVQAYYAAPTPLP